MSRVLICCEFSGRVRSAFRALGHDAWSCDLLPAEDGSPYHIQADFRSVNQDSWDFVGYHYECKVMANSGVKHLYKGGKRWLEDGTENERYQPRWLELQAAADIFNLTIRDPRPGYAENSIMHCHAKALIDREQDQVIQPWWFGVPKFKGAAIWVRGGLPKLKATDRLTPPAKGTPEHKEWSSVHRASPGPNRWKERSRTLEGVARAFAAQWSPLLSAPPASTTG